MSKAQPAGYYAKQRKLDRGQENPGVAQAAAGQAALLNNAQRQDAMMIGIPFPSDPNRHRGLGIVDAKGPDSRIRPSGHNAPAFGSLQTMWGENGNLASEGLREKFKGSSLIRGPGASGMGDNAVPAWKTRAEAIKNGGEPTSVDFLTTSFKYPKPDTPGEVANGVDFQLPGEPSIEEILGTTTAVHTSMRNGFGNPKLLSGGLTSLSNMATKLEAASPVDTGGLFSEKYRVPDVKLKGLSVW